MHEPGVALSIVVFEYPFKPLTKTPSTKWFILKTRPLLVLDAFKPVLEVTSVKRVQRKCLTVSENNFVVPQLKSDTYCKGKQTREVKRRNMMCQRVLTLHIQVSLRQSSNSATFKLKFALMGIRECFLQNYAHCKKALCCS